MHKILKFRLNEEDITRAVKEYIENTSGIITRDVEFYSVKFDSFNSQKNPTKGEVFLEVIYVSTSEEIKPTT